MTKATTAVKRFIRGHSRLIGSVLAVQTERREIVLSYDDGPEPGGTERVLDALADRGASATFFVLLTRARLYTSLLADVVAAGHEIALHGEDHKPLTDFRFSEVVARTSAAKAELEDLTGQRVRWVRPPYGRQSFSTWLAIRHAGVQSVLWGPTMWDSRHVTDDERVQQALRGAVPGAILLGHDGHAGPADGVDDGPSPEFDRGRLTRRVLDEYDALGLSGCSLGRALDNGTVMRGAWFSR
ncbi:MAG: polysaccharide deacetylase family protein [Lacisediminihabitans sp.]